MRSLCSIPATISGGETEARPPERRRLQGHGHTEARPHRSRRSGAVRGSAGTARQAPHSRPRADLRAPPRPKVTTRGAARCCSGRVAAATAAREPLRSFPERKASLSVPRSGMRDAGTAAAPQHAVQRPGFAVHRHLQPCPPARRCASLVCPLRVTRLLRAHLEQSSRLSQARFCALLRPTHRPTCHHGRAPSVPHYVLHTPCDTASHEGQRAAPQTPQPRIPHVNDPHASLPLHAFSPTRAARSL